MSIDNVQFTNDYLVWKNTEAKDDSVERFAEWTELRALRDKETDDE